MTVELKWEDYGGEWVARLPWGSPLQSRYYDVYPWKDGYSFHRPDHPILGKFDGVESTAEAAKWMCEVDFERVGRLHRWERYMIENDPPDG